MSRKPKKKKKFMDFRPKLSITPRTGIPLSTTNDNNCLEPKIFPETPLSPVKLPNGFAGNFEVSEYESEKVLGSGNYGEVKRVRHKLTKELFALKTFRVVENGGKVIDTDGNTEDMGIRAIEMELRLLNMMNSPYIISMKSYKVDRFFVYALLEYMNCGSLDKILKVSGPFPQYIVSKISKYILLGLDYLHSEKRIIHRDLTLANILVHLPSFESSSEISIKISDFGMANERKKNGKEIFRSFVGKTSHMSPLRLKGLDHTFISDVWSLGLCILELVTGKFPLKTKRDDYFEMIECLDKLAKGVNMFIDVDYKDKDFEDFCSKCLEVDDKKRETARVLLQHSFITKYCNKSSGNQSLEEWLISNYIKKLQD